MEAFALIFLFIMLTLVALATWVMWFVAGFWGAFAFLAVLWLLWKLSDNSNEPLTGKRYRHGYNAFQKAADPGDDD